MTTPSRPFQMQPSGLLTGKNRDDLAEYPPDRVSVSADASLTNNQTQWIPPGNGLATSLTDVSPTMAIREDTLTQFTLRFVGDAANIAGETLDFFARVDGQTFLIAAAVPTTAGIQSRSGTLPLPIVVGRGTKIDIGLDPSAVLTAVVTLIAVSLG